MAQLEAQPDQALLVASNQQEHRRSNSYWRGCKIVCCISNDVPRNSRTCFQNFCIDSDSVLCSRKRNYSIICVSAVIMIISLIIDIEEGDAGYGALVGIMGISMLCFIYFSLHEGARCFFEGSCDPACMPSTDPNLL